MTLFAIAGFRMVPVVAERIGTAIVGELGPLDWPRIRNGGTLDSEEDRALLTLSSSQALISFLPRTFASFISSLE